MIIEKYFISNKKSSQKSQENVSLAVSFEEKNEDQAAVKEEAAKQKKEPELPIQISAEEMKKKQAKKDEDPRITKFKNAESVREIYQLAEELIAGDGKKKLLKQIKQLKKALNLSVLKAQ